MINLWDSFVSYSDVVAALWYSCLGYCGVVVLISSIISVGCYGIPVHFTVVWWLGFEISLWVTVV